MTRIASSAIVILAVVLTFLGGATAITFSRSTGADELSIVSSAIIYDSC